LPPSEEKKDCLEERGLQGPAEGILSVFIGPVFPVIHRGSSVKLSRAGLGLFLIFQVTAGIFPVAAVIGRAGVAEPVNGVYPPPTDYQACYFPRTLQSDRSLS